MSVSAFVHAIQLNCKDHYSNDCQAHGHWKNWAPKMQLQGCNHGKFLLRLQPWQVPALRNALPLTIQRALRILNEEISECTIAVACTVAHIVTMSMHFSRAKGFAFICCGVFICKREGGGHVNIWRWKEVGGLGRLKIGYSKMAIEVGEGEGREGGRGRLVASEFK